jgi:hypothetical protein
MVYVPPGPPAIEVVSNKTDGAGVHPLPDGSSWPPVVPVPSLLVALVSPPVPPVVPASVLVLPVELVFPPVPPVVRVLEAPVPSVVRVLEAPVAPVVRVPELVVLAAPVASVSAVPPTDTVPAVLSTGVVSIRSVLPPPLEQATSDDASAMYLMVRPPIRPGIILITL